MCTIAHAYRGQSTSKLPAAVCMYVCLDGMEMSGGPCHRCCDTISVGWIGTARLENESTVNRLGLSAPVRDSECLHATSSESACRCCGESGNHALKDQVQASFFTVI